MNKVLSILLFVFSTMFIFEDNAEAASRCKNGVTITYSIPESIEFTYEDFNDLSRVLYTLRPTSIIGECKKSGKYSSEYLYIVNQLSRPATDCGNNKEHIVVNDPENLLKYEVNSCSGIIALSQDNSTNASSVTPSVWSENMGITDSTGMGVRLIKPPKPGVTLVNPGFMFSGNYYSILGGYKSTLEKENVTIIMPNQLKLVYKATCRASVHDIDFETQHAETILEFSEGIEKIININLNCHETLPSYTITIIPDNGVADESIGTIKTIDNPTIGYRLTWDNNEVAKAGSAVSFGKPIIPRKRPSSPYFSIPIKVNPIAFVKSYNEVQTGPATATITIKLTYN